MSLRDSLAVALITVRTLYVEGEEPGDGVGPWQHLQEHTLPLQNNSPVHPVNSSSQLLGSRKEMTPSPFPLICAKKKKETHLEIYFDKLKAVSPWRAGMIEAGCFALCLFTRPHSFNSRTPFALTAKEGGDRGGRGGSRSHLCLRFTEEKPKELQP